MEGSCDQVACAEGPCVEVEACVLTCVEVSWVELSTGQFQAADVSWQRLPDELGRLAPAECLTPEDGPHHLGERAGGPGACARSGLRRVLEQAGETIRPARRDPNRFCSAVGGQRRTRGTPVGHGLTLRPGSRRRHLFGP